MILLPSGVIYLLNMIERIHVFQCFIGPLAPVLGFDSRPVTAKWQFGVNHLYISHICKRETNHVTCVLVSNEKRKRLAGSTEKLFNCLDGLIDGGNDNPIVLQFSSDESFVEHVFEQLK
jgi:hypothetical protein